MNSWQHPLDFYYTYLGQHINAPHALTKIAANCMYCGRSHEHVDVFESGLPTKANPVDKPKCNACYSITRKHELHNKASTKGAIMSTHGAIITEHSVVFYSNVPVLNKGCNIQRIDPNPNKINIAETLKHAALSLNTVPALLIRFDSDPAITIPTLKLTTHPDSVFVCGHRDTNYLIQKNKIFYFKELLADIPFETLKEAASIESLLSKRADKSENLIIRLEAIYEKTPRLNEIIKKFPSYGSKEFWLLRDLIA